MSTKLGMYSALLTEFLWSQVLIMASDPKGPAPKRRLSCAVNEIKLSFFILIVNQCGEVASTARRGFQRP